VQGCHNITSWIICLAGPQLTLAAGGNETILMHPRSLQSHVYRWIVLKKMRLAGHSSRLCNASSQMAVMFVFNVQDLWSGVAEKPVT
jgi:hypothetical protein